MKGFRRRIADSAQGPATFVAAGTKVRGELTGDGALIVCGEVDGDCAIAGPVTLAETGRWTGTLKATDVVVAGCVEGDVVADDRVEVAGTARISGSLSGHSIAVAEGAVIEGEIKVTTGKPAVKFEEKRDLVIDQRAAG